MCGRFVFDIPPDMLVATFGLAELPAVQPRYNVAPTQQVPVIRASSDGCNRLDYLQWGLIPSWAKERSIGSKMINARSETVTEKPAFRQAVKYRRCLVPASGFYEWVQEGKLKLPYSLQVKGGSPMVFAGLWESWKGPEGETVESCTILTTAANPLVQVIHERMPVILHPGEYGVWLDRNINDASSLTHLFQPYPADLMEMRRVSPLVNSPKNDLVQLLNPVEEAISQDFLGI